MKNKEDAHLYTKGSNIVLDWECPDCLTTWQATPNKMSGRKYLCKNCNHYGSYPEKFVSCFLDQLCEFYKKDVRFEWSDNKRYDFWLPFYNMIIETHGEQHYKENFVYKNARTLYEEQCNDEYKKEMALENGIEEYIVLNCSKSDCEWIKNEIRNSLLRTILMFDMDDINWELCDQSSFDNIIKDVCRDYEAGLRKQELIQKYNKSKNTIREYLKTGAKYNWCSYDPKKAVEENVKNNTANMIKRTAKKIVQIDLDGNEIRTFDSIQGAQRELNIYGIWDCLVGERKTCGGYKWKYYNAEDKTERSRIYNKRINSKKPIEAFKDGKSCGVFHSPRDFSDRSKELFGYSVPQNHISAVANHKPGRKSVHGFTFEWVDDKTYENYKKGD